MKRYFSIGEMSNLFNLPVQTLRYYDQIELLKAARVDEDSGYRYYTADQFVALDFIKVLKTLNTPLKEMKQFLSGPLKLEHVKDLLCKHEHTIEEQIRQLSTLKGQISKKRSEINCLQQCGNGIITPIELPERRIAVKRIEASSQAELEVMCYEAFGKLERETSYLTFQPGSIVSRHKLMVDHIIQATHVFIMNPERLFSGYEYEVLPAGTYLSLVIEDTYMTSYERHYNEFKQYIVDEGISTVGDFIECCIMSLPTSDGSDTTLWELQIKITP
ncbi:MerR family transcriptional regulator [Paenibacillus sp. 481]|uniref:MerR family transcriptional regulator n=1 Tax=Paenibacillus sp. 481 TaxID=2835869 RepID=UPI001E572F94|nr:MerR family transcriptional regulator [Paenibacillus sp. 481]UHA74789.1 MerR family transcriptional regulator [Paenibacillus sp. 481]